MDRPLIDFQGNSLKWKPSDAPLIPSSVDYASEREGSNNPFDMVACESAASLAAENDPFEIVLLQSKNQVNANKTPVEISNVDETCSLTPNAQRSAWRENPMNCDLGTDDQFLSYLDDILPPDIFQSSILEISDYLDVSIPTPNATTQPSFSYPSPSSKSPDLLALTNGMSKEERTEWFQKRMSNIINMAERKSLDRKRAGSLSCIPENVSSSCFSALMMPSTTRVDLSHLASDDSNFGVEEKRTYNVDSGASNYLLKSCCGPKKEVKASSKRLSLNALDIRFASNSHDSLLTDDLTDLIPARELDLVDGESLSSVPQPDWSLLNLSSNDLESNDEAQNRSDHNVQMKAPEIAFLCDPPPCEQNGVGRNLNIPQISITNSDGDTCSAITPPSLPPLPLCEDAVRKLSLCSKFSPSQKQKSVTKAIKSSAPENSRPVPAHGNRLLLRRPADLPKSAKGPMKATVPIQNMTKQSSPVSENLTASAARRIYSSPCSKLRLESHREPSLQRLVHPSRASSASGRPGSPSPRTSGRSSSVSPCRRTSAKTSPIPRALSSGPSSPSYSRTLGRPSSVSPSRQPPSNTSSRPSSPSRCRTLVRPSPVSPSRQAPSKNSPRPSSISHRTLARPSSVSPSRRTLSKSSPIPRPASARPSSPSHSRPSANSIIPGRPLSISDKKPSGIRPRFAEPGHRSPASNLCIPNGKSQTSSSVLQIQNSKLPASSRPSNIPGCRSPRPSQKLASTSHADGRKSSTNNCSPMPKPRALADVNGSQPLWKSPMRKTSQMVLPRPSIRPQLMGKENHH